MGWVTGSRRKPEPRSKPSGLLTAGLQWERTIGFWSRYWRAAVTTMLGSWWLLACLFAHAVLGWATPAPMVWAGLLLVLSVGFGTLYRRWSVRYRGELIAVGKPRPRLLGLHLLGEWRQLSKHAELAARCRSQFRAGCLKFGLVYKARQTGRTVVEFEPYLQNLRVTADGDVAGHAEIGRMFLTAPEFGKHASEFAASVRARSFVVKPTGQGGVDFLWRFTDELERTMPINRLPVGPKDRWTVGVTGTGVFHLPRNLSWLIVGESGSGKSEAGNSAFADMLRSNDEWIDLYMFDPKGGQQWGWVQRLAKADGSKIRVVEFHTPADGPKAVVDMVGRALKVVQDRQARDGQIDLDDFSQPITVQTVISRENPRVVVFIDELLEVPQLLTDTPTKPSNLVRFVSVSRSGGGMAICMTQDGTKEAVGKVRDRFPIRVALRMPTETSTAMVLHNEARALGARNWEIPDDMPGVGYAFDAETGTMTKFRLAYVSPKVIEADLQYGRMPAGMPTGSVDADPFDDVAVYKIKGKPGPKGSRRLLYVGKAKNPARREAEHRRDQPWAAEIDLVEWEWCDNEAEAVKLEAWMIENLHPKYNVQHNTKGRGKAWSSVPELDEPEPVVVEGDVDSDVAVKPRLRPWSRRLDNPPTVPVRAPYPVTRVNGHHPPHEGSE